MDKLEKSFTVILEKCTHAKEDDAILIIADTNKAKLGEAFLQTVKCYTRKAILAIMKPTSIDGEEPSAEIADMMLEADIIFALTTWSLTHTKASKDAMKKGAKMVSMPAVGKETLEKYIDVDYDDVEKKTLKLSEMLNKADGAKITTPNGTSLILDLSGQKGIAMSGICKKGRFINLPDGEALISPKSAEGKLVIDGSMPPDSESEWGKIGLIKNPITLIINNGKIISIAGKDEADVLSKIFSDHPENAKIVAEFGIGTNPKARITGNVTVDEKALGTIHIAFGNSANIGGTNPAPIHLDGVIRKPTVWLDGKCIIINGKIIF